MTHQKLHGRKIASLCSHTEGRETIAVRAVDIRTHPHQIFDDGQLAGAGCLPERRPARLVSTVDIGALFLQISMQVGVQILSRGMLSREWVRDKGII